VNTFTPDRFSSIACRCALRCPSHLTQPAGVVAGG
jgi:hypothetical protein